MPTIPAVSIGRVATSFRCDVQSLLKPQRSLRGDTPRSRFPRPDSANDSREANRKRVLDRSAVRLVSHRMLPCDRTPSQQLKEFIRRHGWGGNGRGY